MSRQTLNVGYAPHGAGNVRLSRAFTLIELLVVIAIISLLVSVLLPAINKAKQLAQGVVCQTQLKNIYVGIVYYTNDYDDTLPPHNSNWGKIPKPWNPSEFYGSPTCYYQSPSGMLVPYIGEEPQTWTCPAATDPLHPFWEVPYVHRWLYYGGNINHVFGHLNIPTTYPPYKKMESFIQPDTLAMMIDTDMIARAYCTCCPNGLPASTDQRWPLAARHLGKVNILAVAGNMLAPASPEDLNDNRDDLWGHDRLD